MVTRFPTYRPERSLVTESVTVGLPLATKNALTKAARRNGTSVSGIVRDAVEEVVARYTVPVAPKTGAER